MKTRLILAVLLLTLATCFACGQQSAQVSQNSSPLPAPTGFVNDYAGVIDEGAKQALEQKLRLFKEKTAPSAELAVVVVRSTEGRDIFDYSLAVARGWGIGSKEDDNPSALLLVAIDDRKYFTQVSRDLEDDLPDGVVGDLQRQFLVPEFKKQNYAKGISDTMDAYMATIERKGGVGTGPAPKAEQPARTRRSVLGGGVLETICCLAIILIVLPLLFGRGRRGGGGFGGGWGGGAFGGAGRRRTGFESALPWIIGSAIGSSIGSGSSSSAWGGSSGDGGGWGGFGGGGDFGGGGAGGDW
jgi:uncharacterized protein